MSTLATLTVRLVTDAGKFTQGLDKASSSAQGFMGHMQSLGKVTLGVASAGLAVGAAGVAAVGAVISQTLPLAADFQDQVVGLGIAASQSGLSFQELHDAALQVGGDVDLLGVSATGAADSMTGLYKAGLTTTEIFGDLQGYMAGTAELGGALRAAIDLAAATELDMVQASDLAAVALATFGGGMETAAERAEFVNSALNNMVQAADASVAEVSDLANAMRNVGPTAAAMGIPLEDVNNALAILSTRGIAGAEAGTAFKSMLTNMQRPTNAVTGALNELGVSLYDTGGVFRGLPAIIGDFEQALYGTQTVTSIVGGRTAEQNHQLDLSNRAYNQATDAVYKHNAGIKILSDSTLARYQDQLVGAQGEMTRLGGIMGDAVSSTRELTDEQRQQYIQTLAGTYGMNAMNTLVGEGTEGWYAMADATANAAGIQEQAAARAKTFNGLMEAAKGTVERWAISIGESFLPAGEDLLGVFSNIADVVGPRVADFFENVLGPQLALAAGFVDSFVAALLTGEDPITALQGAFRDIGLDQVAEGIGNVAARMQDLITTVQPYVEKLVGWISQHVEWKDVLLGLGVAILSVVVPAIAGIIGAIAPVVAVFVAVVAAVAAMRTAWESDFLGIRTALTAAWAEIQPVLQQLWDMLVTLFQGDIDIESFLEGMGDVGQKLAGVFGNIWAVVQPKLQEFWGSIVAWFVSVDWAGMAQTGLDVLATAFGTIWSLVQPKLEEFFLSIAAWFDSIDWGALVLTMHALFLETLAGFAESIAETFASWGEAFSDWSASVDWEQIGYDVVTFIIDGLKNFPSNVEETLTSWIAAITDNIEGVDWGSIGTNVVDGIISGLGSRIDALATAAADLARGALRAAKDALGIESPSRLAALTVGVPIAQGIIGGMMDQLASGMPSMSRMFDSMMGGGRPFAVPAMAGVGASPAGVGGGGGFGDVYISITESDNPQATADAVIQALRDRGMLAQTSYR